MDNVDLSLRIFGRRLGRMAKEINMDFGGVESKVGIKVTCTFPSH